jgi:hypothetical protein
MPARSPDFCLAWLEASNLDESAIATNPEFAAMLDPHRTVEPLPLRCGRERCNRAISYWALSGDGARVVFAPRRRKRPEHRKGTYPTEPDPHPITHVNHPPETIVSSEADLLWPGLEPTGRYPEYVEWVMAPTSNVELVTNPDLASGYPLRFLFRCPNPSCTAVYRLTNKGMLRLLLAALSHGKREIRPGRIGG